MFPDLKTSPSGVDFMPMPAPALDDSTSYQRLFNEANFWQLIALIDFNSKPQQAIRPLIDHLKSLSTVNIHTFQDILMKKLQALDEQKYTLHIGKSAYHTNQHFSTTYFLQARAAVIAKGQDYYETVLAQPDAMSKDMIFEPLLGAAAIAYEEKTAAPFFYSAKKNKNYNKEKKRSSKVSLFSCI